MWLSLAAISRDITKQDGASLLSTAITQNPSQFELHMSFRRLANTATNAQVSPSIVVIIIVLTIIFFLSAFLHLLIRWLARNPRRRGSNNRIVTLTALQGQLQQLFSMQDAGIERALIDELPVFVYKAVMGGLKEGADCAICLCEFQSDDQLRLLPSCGHAFHTDCIDTWLLSHSTCPLCRTALLPECWINTNPSSENATTAELLDANSSSRRSSHGLTLITPPFYVEEPQSQYPDPLSDCLSANHAGSASPAEDNCTNHTRLVSTEEANHFNHARSESSAENHSSNIHTNSEGGHFTNHAKLMGTTWAEVSIANARLVGTNEAGFCNTRSVISTAATVESGRLSYTSLGNQSFMTDAVSETYESERASIYGSGRRMSVQLGKCRMIEQGKTYNVNKSRGGASRRSYSKGSYEYVVDNSSNLEVIIPANPLPKPPLVTSSKKLNDLLNMSHRTTASTEFVPSPANHADGSQNLGSSCWASASFRRLKCLTEEINRANAPITSSSSDQSATNWVTMELDSSTATSMRVNAGSDGALSPEMVSQRLRVMSSNKETGLSKGNLDNEHSKRAVSFRLPSTGTPASVSARLKASGSRRALSENEAFSFWEPTIEQSNHGDDAGITDDDQILINNDNNISHRSSSFAKRTVDWLVGWQKRTVHPDEFAAAGCDA